MITRKQIAAIRGRIEGLDASTQRAVEAALANLDPGDYEAMRRALEVVLRPVIETSAQLSAELAASVYNSWRMADIGATVEVAARSVFNDVKYTSMVNTALSKSSIEEAVNVVMSYVGYTNRASYSSTMFAAGKADSRRPRFARVPEDDEACDFCMMLASRGFEYSYGVDGDNVHNHAKCRCTYVASWSDDPKAQGYDDKAWYDRWQNALDEQAKEAAERKGTTEAEEKKRLMTYYANSANNAKSKQ